MSYVIWFILSFILIYLLYYIFSIRKATRDTKKSVEAQFLIYSNKLDINKFSYYRFVRVVGLVTCFDIALVATIVGAVEELIWQILFGFVAVIPILVISFLLLGKYYTNKQHKDNKKELEKEKKKLDKIDRKKHKKRKLKRG